MAAFQFYGDLITSYSVSGTQDVDTVRASYFAGQSAMAIWSTFLLDELAGLRNDAKPNCPECEEDPKFLAQNTGVVAEVAGPDGEPAQFGEVSSWAITATAKEEPSQKFIEYMLGDGYTDWVAIAPEGKYPVRWARRRTRPSTSTPGRASRMVWTRRRRCRSTTPRRSSTS